MIFNYNGVLSFLYTKLQSLYGYTLALLQNGIYANLISVIAYGIERLGYNDEVMTKEGIFRTAEQRFSNYHHAWGFAYIPHRKRGGITNLAFSPDANFKDHVPGIFVYNEANVKIARWTKVQSEDGLVSSYVTEDSAYQKGQILHHYNLPCTGTNPPFTPQATTINNFGLAKIPVTLATAVVNPNGASVGNHQITPGTQITIRGTVSFDGDFITQPYPSFVLPGDQPYYVVIQTSYINQTVSEVFPLGSSMSAGHALVKAKEGTPKVFDYIANGSVNEKIQILSPNTDSDETQVLLMANDDVTVIAEAIKLTISPWLVRDMTQYYYTVEDDPQFRFINIIGGDGIKTRKFPIGQKIRVKYAETLGSTGGSESLNTINQIPDGLIADTGAPITTLFVTNPDPLPPGEDLEAIRDIKENARARFQDRLLAISQYGWPAVVKSHPSVLKAVTWNGNDINPYTIDPTQNVVFVAAVDKNGIGINPLSQLATDVSFNYLRTLSGKTDFIDWEPSLFINLKAKVSSRLKKSDKSAYEKRIADAFVARWGIFNTDFRNEIYGSQATDLVQSDPSVAFSILDLEYSENSERATDLRLGNPFNLKGTFRKSTDSPLDSYVSPTGTSVKFWIKRKLDGVTSKWYLIAQQNLTLITDFIIGDPRYTGFQLGSAAPGSNSVALGGSPTAEFYNSTSVTIYNILGDPLFSAPDPSSSDIFLNTDFTTTERRLINPGPGDDNGYFLRVTYKTIDSGSPTKFVNDIRLPYFNNITDVLPEEIEFEYL